MFFGGGIFSFKMTDWAYFYFPFTKSYWDDWKNRGEYILLIWAVLVNFRDKEGQWYHTDG